ncbi:MAG TPA: 16S rRNA (adenine(1518)-N(6)/adenine(1519)-N(6))-dimethyltransferase RsmA [Pirellulales bacterium]
MSQRQTVSYLKRRFAKVGLTLQSRHGQNFLVDLNLLRLLAEIAGIEPRDVVLEIGTGTGALTAMLARQAAAVVTVEIDPRLHQLAYEELIDFENVTMLQQDALAGKNRLNPRVLEAVAERLNESPDRRFKLAANLPFSVATPVISNLLDLDTPPETMTVTIQKELADRVAAKPSTKDYGAFSIWAQSQCEVEIMRLLPPEAFWPRPKVTSAIVQLRFDPHRRRRLRNRAFFHSFVRSLFLHRRKFLRSDLASAFKGRLTKAEADALIESLGIPPTSRAEELDVPTVIQLADAVEQRLEQTAGTE